MLDVQVTRPLSDRIAALYRAKTGSKSSHGAQAWFADLLGVTPRAVQHWKSGKYPMEGPALAFLTKLERVAQMIRAEEETAAARADGTVGGEWDAAAGLYRADDLRSLLTPE